MKTALSVALLAVLLAACATGAASTPTPPAAIPATLQLQWITQAQFAGYYVALDKGWYAEEGIDLTIRPGGPDITPADEVASGRAEFGTGLLADLIAQIQQGKPLISVAQIQQSNGLILIAKASSGIQTPQDFRGKRVGVWLGSWEAQFNALAAKEGLSPDEFTLVPQGFSMDAFLNDDLDVASAMIYNEYHTVLESGYRPDEINIIDYADYGLNFPGDLLMTHTRLVEENPRLVEGMVRASLRGWKYALENPEEAVDIVLKYDTAGLLEREHQLTMMDEIRRLVESGLHPPGYTNRDEVRSVINTLASYEVILTPVDPDAVFTNQFWEAARSEVEAP
ncbi:MAG: myristoyl transferase [Anaerolineae bacterium]|nr:MAG: myristoyl transferase [Anaerolineae bacterium]